MQRKQKYIITLVIILIVITFWIYDYYKYSEVTKLVDIEALDVVTATYTNTSSNGEKSSFVIDASENATLITVNNKDYIVDNDKLFKILSKYECVRSRNHYFPYQSDSIVAEISLIQNYRPKNILLGDFNICYESGDKKVFDIIDGELLLDEIVELVNQ